MSVKEANVPPIVEELAGGDEVRLGVAAQAYLFLWRYSCGENGDLQNKFEEWVVRPQNAWLEQQPSIRELTPLARMRMTIEKEKQRLKDKGFDPCSNFSLN